MDPSLNTVAGTVLDESGIDVLENLALTRLPIPNVYPQTSL